jgi:hypothetical protein
MHLWTKHGGISTEVAGLLSIWVGRGTVHILPRFGFRQWGFSEDWYDGTEYLLGLGPLLLLIWSA